METISMTCVFMDDLTPDKGRKLNVHKAFRRHPGRLFDMNDCSNWFRMITNAIWQQFTTKIFENLRLLIVQDKLFCISA